MKFIRIQFLLSFFFALQLYAEDVVSNRAPRPPQTTIESELKPDDFGQSVCCQLPRHVNIIGNLTVGGNAHFSGEVFFESGIFGDNANILIVKKGTLSGPNEFNSVKAAVDSITTNSATNQFAVNVYPGVYVEDTINLKPYVSLKSEAPLTTVITPDDPNKNILVMSPSSIVQGIQFTGATGSGKAAIVYNGGGVAGVDRCIFNNCNIFVNQDGTVAPLSTLYLTENFFGNAADFEFGIKVRSSGGVATTCIVDGLAWQGLLNPSLNSVIDISDPQVRVFFSSLDMGWLVPGSGDGFTINNGASVALRSASLYGFDTAIYVGDIGSGPFLSISGVSGAQNTEDLNIMHTGTTGSVNASFARAKVIIDPGTTIALNLLDPDDTGTVTVGPQFIGDAIASVTNISPATQQGSNMGVTTGGALTIGSGLSVDIAAGTGYLMTGVFPNDDLKYVTWNSQSVAVSADADNFIYIDALGIAQSSLARPSLTGGVLLGKARTDSSDVVYLQDVEAESVHTATQLDDSWRRGFGPIYYSGSIVSPSSTPPQLDVTSGRYFLGTHEYMPSGGSDVSFITFRRGGSNFTIGVSQQNVPFFYDSAPNTLTALAPGDFARHALYVVNDGVDEKYILQYGQQVFGSLIAAQAGGIPPQPGTWTDNITLIASIIVDDTSIVEIRDERPRLAFKASGVTAVTDHGSLSSLGDNDHPQYLLRNGSNPMIGDLDMGSNNIVTSGLVDGVDVSAHAARHLPNTGADPLATGTPVTIGTSNSIGVANSFARSDHIHAHGNQTDGSLHAAATAMIAGFMSAADKTKLDAATSSNTFNTLVLRNGAGDFSAGDITSSNLIMSNRGQIRLRELTVNGTDYIALRAPSSLTGTTTYTLPADGSNGQVLKTNGAGILFWSNSSSGDINNDGNSFTSDITIGTNDDFALIFETNGTPRMQISSTGAITMNDLASSGVMHTNNSGVVSTSQIVNDDITNLTITDAKLSPISSAGKVLNTATTAASANTPSAIVARDASGNFVAGTITANLIGNATTATSATNFSGSLLGDVTGTQGSTTVALVGGQSAANVAAATVLANNATDANTVSRIVRRDASGNFSAGTITANLIGSVTGAASLNVLKTGDTMTGNLIMDNQKQIRFREASGNGANYIALQAPSALSADLTMTLPNVDGAANQALSTNGSGTLGWVYSPSSLMNYRVHAYLGANLTLSLLTGTTVTLSLDTEVFDPNNNFNTSTYTYTAPLTGIYWIAANVSLNSIGSLTRRLHLVKNGSNVVGASLAVLIPGVPVTFTGIMPLTAGDTLRIDLDAGIGDIVLAGDTSLFIQLILA